MAQVVAEVHEDNKHRCDELLRHQGGFTTITWERPTFAIETNLDNWFVYAHRWKEDGGGSSSTCGEDVDDGQEAHVMGWLDRHE